MYRIEFADRLSRNRLFISFAVASLVLAVIASVALSAGPASAEPDKGDQSTEAVEVHEDGSAESAILIEGEYPEGYEEFAECEAVALDELDDDTDAIEFEDELWEECKQHLPVDELEQIEADMEAWAPFEECMSGIYGDFEDVQIVEGDVEDGEGVVVEGVQVIESDIEDLEDLEGVDFEDIDVEDLEEGSSFVLESSAEEEACMDLLPEDIQQEMTDLDAEWAEFDECAVKALEGASEDTSGEELEALLEKNCGDLAPEDADFGFEVVDGYPAETVIAE